MAVIFLLGPGMWDFEKKGTESDSSPLEVRRNIAKILRGAGQKNEDMIQKFIRLLHSKVTDVLLYWPPLAKMQTTYDELLLLYMSAKHSYAGSGSPSGYFITLLWRRSLEKNLKFWNREIEVDTLQR